MYAAPWLTNNDPNPMLKFLRGKTSERKLRLFGCACYRRVADALDATTRKAIRVAEDYADGRVKACTLRNAIGRGGNFIGAPFLPVTEEMDFAEHIRRSANHCIAIRPRRLLAGGSSFRRSERSQEQAHQAGLVREIFGNPFAPVHLNPFWLAWDDATIPRLAHSIYQERAFERLPILADALEEAGCSDETVLDHCRQPGEHVRGCWLLDLCLAKE